MNSQGWSTNPSTVTSILMATKPGQIKPAATTTNIGIYVDVAWTAPSNTGGTGVVITAYKI